MLALGLVVAGGLADQGTAFPFLVIGVAALGLGTLYLLFAFAMLMFGGVLALLIRAELFQPGLQLVNRPCAARRWLLGWGGAYGRVLARSHTHHAFTHLAPGYM